MHGARNDWCRCNALYTKNNKELVQLKFFRPCWSKSELLLKCTTLHFFRKSITKSLAKARAKTARPAYFFRLPACIVQPFVVGDGFNGPQK